MPKFFHKSLKTLKIERYGGAELIEHGCGSCNRPPKISVLPEKITTNVYIFKGFELENGMDVLEPYITQQIGVALKANNGKYLCYKGHYIFSGHCGVNV